MEELYPGHAEELRKRNELAERIERAHSAVLPGALRDCFAAGPPMVDTGGASFTLQLVTLGLAANLERIKSPLLDVVRIMREVFAGKEEGEMKNEGPGGRPPEKGEGRLKPELQLKPEGEISEGEGAAKTSADNFKEVARRVGALKFEEEQIAETCFVFICPQKRIRQLLDAGRQTFREAAMEELGDKLHPTQMAVLQRTCAQHYVASFATIIGYGTPPPEEGAVVFPQPSPGGVTGSVGG